ncbi:MAG: peptide-methionine (S)-S-oxide reductase MsrA [Gammaproteobacteria bacterium]|nr:peptide-methionine (S)-S-oxide reductase MsrA [Gammaproteobacteria bacterium]
MTNKAIFAAGCFWGIEDKFATANGVVETEVGYIGGKSKNPTYEEICQGDTFHAEAVRVFYDKEIITYDQLLDLFFEIHDPTTLNSQGPDFGTQYRSAIFCQNDFETLSSQNKIKELNRDRFNNKIVTTFELSNDFWIAEEYHQKYLKKKKFNFFSK